jgi:hypothetical protein
VMDHHVKRRQRFDQKHGQRFGRGGRVHGKQRTARSLGGLDVGIRREVEVERALGGGVEFFLSRGFRMGRRDLPVADRYLANRRQVDWALL